MGFRLRWRFHNPGAETHVWIFFAHAISASVDGVLGGCNTGSMSGWSGNLHIDTENDAEKVMNPGTFPDSRVPDGSPSPSPSQPPANSCDPRVDICVH
jgi:hypothetical protein